jgi:hypothetical protein
MLITEIADQVAQLLEPDPLLRDDGRAEPTVFEADLLYVWAPSETFEPIGQECEQRDFLLRAAWVIETDDTELRSRETSDAIATKSEAYRAAVASQRALTPWYEGLHVEGVDHETLSAIDARGFLMDLTGYRIEDD